MYDKLSIVYPVYIKTYSSVWLTLKCDCFKDQEV